MRNLIEKPLPLIIFMEVHFDILTKEESLEILQTMKKAGFKINSITFEGWTKGFDTHKTLRKIACFLRRTRCTAAPRLGRLEMQINDITSSKAILNGDWGALEICFKR